MYQSVKMNERGKSMLRLSTFRSYRAFHGFGQAKIPDGGSALGSGQFSILPQLHQIMMLNSKGVKIDANISNWHC